MQTLSNFGYLSQVILSIVAFIFLKKYATNYYKYFFAYVVFALFFESFGKVLKMYKITSFEFFNIYTFFEYNLVAIIYYKLTKEAFSHKWIKYLIIFFNVVYLISFVFLELKNYTVILGAVIVSFFMVLYLKELLNSDKIINFTKDLSFWITIAFLLYYLTTIPFYSVFFIIGIESKSQGVVLFILQSVILILRSLLLINGILWCTKQKI